MLNFIKKHRKGLKLVLMLGVFALVVFEFGVLSKEFSLASLRSYMNSYGFGFVFTILILGLVSPLPMIGYDLSLLAYEGIELDKRNLFEKSYLVNAYNNMIGTGGILSLALRYEFYAGKTESKEDFTKKITRITPYFLSGLSVLALVGLVALTLARFGLVDQGLVRLRAYWIVLLIVSLYLALIFFLSNRSKISFLGGLPKRVQGQQILTSILEWVFLFMNFYIISRLMDIRVGIFYQLVAFTVASALGLISQVPGGLGSFEIVIITAMAKTGLDEELIASWLIFYRLSAYVAPFVLGSVFFAKHIGKSLNDKFNAAPKRIFKEVLHKLNSGLILLYGLNQILTVLDPPYLGRLGWLRRLPLSSWNVVGRFPGLLLGFLFILLARLSWDKQKSLTKALSLLGLFSLVSQLVKGQGFIGILPILIILGLAFYTREVLKRDKFIYSWEYMSIDLGMGVLIIFYYMYRMGQTSSHTLAIRPGVKLVSLVFMALILFASGYLLMSLARSRDTIGKKPDLVELEDFMDKYGPGKSTHAGLSYLGDKYIYYYENENREKTVAFQFAKINNKVIVLGQPFGKEEDMGKALSSFIEDCDRLSYQPVFYEVSRHLALDLHDYGYDFIKFGEEAIVDLRTWNLDGHKNASKRNTLNRFKKDGFFFEIASPPHSESLMKELKGLSDIWLGSRGERGFSLGFFKDDYIQRSKLGLVKNADGDLVAFVSLMPMGESKTLTLDLMRYDPSKSPNSTMDFIFLSLMIYGRDEGYDSLTLGMAPLSMVGTMKTSYTSEKIAHMVYKYAGRIYSFKGLRAYKDKYASYWIPRYTSNAPGNWLLYSMLALVLVGRRPVEGAFKISFKEK